MSLMCSFNYLLYNKSCVRLKISVHFIGSKSRFAVQNDEVSHILVS